MKIHWKTAVAWLGSILGLSACDLIGIGVCMYATPYADYDVNITVCDKNGEPIQGIKVTQGHYETGTEPSILSDANGKVQTFLENSNFCEMTLEDIDGLANGGEFEKLFIGERDLELKQTKKGKSWYRGRFKATGTVTMEKKSSEPEQ